MKKKQLSQSSLQRSCPEKITCVTGTAQKMKFSMDFFSKCDLIRRNLWIRSHLLKKSLMENFVFSALRVPFYLERFSLILTKNVCVADIKN